MPTCACVVCGSPAYAYCAGCGVTPYCSQSCQRRDWLDRHKSVCHNLANRPEPLDMDISAAAAALTDNNISPAAPLRRPRSPLREPRKEENNTQKNLHPSGHRPNNKPGVSRPGPNANSRNFNNRPEDRQPRRQNNDEDWSNKGRNVYWNRRNQFGPREHRDQSQYMPRTCPDVDDEDWDAAKPSPKSSEVGPKTTPVKPIQVTTTAVPSKEKEIASPIHIPKITIKREVHVAAANQKEVQIPPANQKEVKSPVANQKSPVSVSDATPIRKLVPKNYMIEVLSVGDAVMMSVDKPAKECAAKVAGFVCLSLHEKYEAEYQQLCDDYGAACENEKGNYTLTPGETFSYFNSEDGGWYRARCLSPSSAALIDGSRVVEITADSKYTRLPEAYHQPEFCCLLQGQVKVGDSLKCILQEKTPNGFKVKIENAEDGSAMGEGVLSRWLPEVQYPAPQPKTATSVTPAGSVLIPDVPRPELVNKSVVHMVHVTDTSHVYLRVADTAAQRDFDAALHDTALYGLTATPLTEPPVMGQYVVSKFEDGHHYRAIVKRTNVRLNKYLLEYVEFGNTQVNTLENLYPCPEKLSIQKLPVVTSCASLRLADRQPLTPPADKYLDQLKDDAVSLVLTIPSGAKAVPSGSEVELCEAESKQSVNKKVEELCTPEWMRLQQKGQDILEVAAFMFSELEYVELPASGCEVSVLDVSTLCGGTVSGCRRGAPQVDHVLGSLTHRMKEYCESPIGSEPYLPKSEELCIAQMPPYPQWFRAVYIGPAEGPGSALAELCFIDYGNVERVPTEGIRKMPTEFVKGVPALANTLEINDFPEKPTVEMLEKAFQYLQVNEEGQGTMRVTRCIKDGPGMYKVDAPELIAAMRAS